jgi:nitroreductase
LRHPKVATPDHSIHELIEQRWSPRAFESARPVPRAELMRLFEAARWAPSSRNEQPWRFLVLDREAAPAERQRLLETLTPSNQAWAAAAPVLVLAAVRTSYEDTGAENKMSYYDAGQAVALLTVQATSQGLSVRQMEGFDRARAREAFGIPAEFEPAVAMAIGYAGDPEALSLDKHKAAELQPRKRRPLSDFVYEGNWNR